MAARAGDVVVFSSLTPHRTGPHRTDTVRKAYILQYAPDGARCPAAGAADAGLQNDPHCQYPVLLRGAPVPPPALSSG